MARRTRGEGSIHRRWDGLWEASSPPITLPDGRRVRIRAAAASKIKAIARRDAKLTELHAEGAGSRQRLTLGELIVRYLEHAAEHLRPSTLATYRRSLEHYAAALHRVQLAELTPYHVDRLLLDLHRAGVSDRSRRYCRLVLRLALAQGVRWRLLRSNPVLETAVPAYRPAERPVWSEAEAARFLASSRAHPWHALFHLALVCGLRRGELLGLRWEDLDLVDGLLRVRQTIVRAPSQIAVGEPKTRRSRRTLRLSPATVALLEAHRGRQEETLELARGAGIEVTGGLVFAYDDGRPIYPTRLDGVYRRLVKAAGVAHVPLHSLRHTHATLRLRAGDQLADVSADLGHHSPAYTMAIYAGHVVESERRLPALEGLLAESSGEPN